MRKVSAAGNVVAAVCLVLGAASVVTASQLLLAKPAVQHASVVGTQTTSSVARGTTVTLWAEVTPHPSIHVYAEGAKDFTAVSLKTTPHSSISVGAVKYPKPDLGGRGLDDPPAYSTAFRIGVPVSITSTAKSGEVVTVAGALTYQACDDRLCYPVTSAPVSWTLTVK